MSQPPYLIRLAFGSGTRLMQQADSLRVSHPKVYDFKNKGGYREAIDTGKVVTSELEIRAGEGAILTAVGDPSSFRSDFARVARTAAAIKAVARRLRPEEAVVLDEIDEEISVLKARLKELRSRRADTVKAAWTRAHVVRLAEVEALLPKDGT